jgi:hypothetical protein
MIDHPGEGTLLDDVVVGLHVNRLVPSHTGSNPDVLAARVLTEGGYVDSTDQVAFADAIVGPPGPLGPPGPVGPQGPEGQWTSMTQAAYDALQVKDPNVLYVIIG